MNKRKQDEVMTLLGSVLDVVHVEDYYIWYKNNCEEITALVDLHKQEPPKDNNLFSLLVMAFGWMGAGIALLCGYSVKVTCKKEE